MCKRAKSTINLSTHGKVRTGQWCYMSLARVEYERTSVKAEDLKSRFRVESYTKAPESNMKK